MPSVVLEVGFHTNSSDAAALKDPAFREAAMKGVEKGLRLKAEGKTCEPFKIASIPNVSGPHNTDIPAEIHYKGYPQFPVEQKTENVGCPDRSEEHTSELQSLMRHSYAVLCLKKKI